MAATREEVFERVKDVLTEQLGVDENEVSEEASFQEDLDADSLDLAELIMELEDQFGIKISDEDAQKIQTVGQAVDYVSSHHKANQDPRPRGADRRAPTGARCRGIHAHELGGRALRLLRAARVPRRLGPRARARARALRPLPRLRRGADGEEPLARGLARELRPRGGRARARRPPDRGGSRGGRR